jgi:3alpha(or 20beta)-hydroxysteroid dehydrogenase
MQRRVAFSGRANARSVPTKQQQDQMMARLQNTVALITGAASGIGLATAQRFAAEGAQLLLVDRDAAMLDAAATLCGSAQVITLCVDLRDDGVHAQYVAHALQHYGRLDIAVFNAGITGVNTPLEDYPVAVFDEVMALNLRAAWLGLRAVIPPMKQQKSGSILFTSSIQGLAALPGTTAYTTSKHALVGMMKGAALELAPHGVRVNTVHPAYTSTPMMHRIHQDVMPDQPEQFEKLLSSSVPMRRYARADEVAQMMAFLASDEASYSTGGCFTVDGGMLAALP